MKITNTTILKKGDLVIYEDEDDKTVFKILGIADGLYFMSRDILEGEDFTKVNHGDFFCNINNLVNNYELVTPEWSVDGLKNGDMYWFINSALTCACLSWSNNSTDNFRKKTNNIFPTQEAAQARYKEIMK